ncbi:hypothetical protein FHS15_002424 [Paenibacillus castaneae]|uniref:hypothetical protein n=1 Tax=Paenibacillus castaneae TaxID=474957 RepID=UPI000C9B2EFD|nr:hypothetical protein [Paenibacillus castaneae]NIK77288.1 hypothetical protein [Paenibacillus castaneae]
MQKLFSFRLNGDINKGFSTELLYGETLLARHNCGGELNLLLENGDRADRFEIASWKAEEAIEKEGKLILRGKSRLPLYTTDLDIEVTYEQVTDRVIKKTIRLFQNDIPRLYISLKNSLEPSAAPRSYWSFDQKDHTGGPAYGVLTDDVFPAAGFVDESGIMVGLLTDSGWKNKWSRLAWRRTSHGNTATIQITDPALLRTATQEERSEGKHHVTLTLGELYGNVGIPFEIKEQSDRRCTFFGRRGYRYTLAMECRGKKRGGPVNLIDSKGNRIDKINDDNVYSVVTQEWLSFVGRSNELPEDGYYTLFFEESNEIETRNIRIFEASPIPLPWHELRQGKELVRTVLIFAEDSEATARNVKLKSQVNLAEGLGFKGSELEKILYADFKMLTWVTEPGIDEPMVVPSTLYFEMYFRDVFWILNGTQDAFLNENILRRIGETMNEQGSVDNIITAYHGSIEHSDNELPYLYLLWSYLNRKRFGSKPDMKKVHEIATHIRQKFDPDGDGVIKTNNPQSAMDVMLQGRPCRFASSQGYYAVALMAAKELGADISEEYVQAAVDAYRGYYAEYGSEGKFIHSFPDNTLGENGDAIGIVANIDLEPEFLSTYIFERSMLDDEMVINTLEKYPVSPEGLMPNICKVDGTFFSKEVNPFNDDLYWKPGTYANGGSWLRKQYVALAVGKYHGWSKADELMKKRLDAELHFDSENPLSREYLSLSGDRGDSAQHRIFGWNLIVLAIHEWLGIRNPEWNPDLSILND